MRIDPKNLAANYQIGMLHFHIGEQLWAAGRTDDSPGRVPRGRHLAG